MLRQDIVLSVHLGATTSQPIPLVVPIIFVTVAYAAGIYSLLTGFLDSRVGWSRVGADDSRYDLRLFHMVATPFDLALDVMDITPQILNAALRAYVRAFRSRDRLMEYISAKGLTNQKDEIVAKLDAVLERGEQLLSSFPGGLPQVFDRDYYTFLAERHSWLDGESLGCIHEFLGWFSWHG